MDTSVIRTVVFGPKGVRNRQVSLYSINAIGIINVSACVVEPANVMHVL